MPPLLVDLSIDFDFWCREDYRWDWGHGTRHSPLIDNTLWEFRYRHMGAQALANETDPRTHADFPPDQLLTQLRFRGLDVRRGYLQLHIADSHEHIMDVLTASPDPGLVINIDAHHDSYSSSSEELNCGNWVSHYAKLRQKPRLWHVYPKWQNKPGEELYHAKRLVRMPWSEPWNLPAGAQLRYVFLCRSRQWVPPHLDNEFIAMARALATYSGQPVEWHELLDIRTFPKELSA